jgi:hypothetical protein
MLEAASMPAEEMEYVSVQKGWKAKEDVLVAMACDGLPVLFQLQYASVVVQS